MKKHLATVNWKTYFDTDNNPRAKRYLESRGYDVFKQVGGNIVRAKKAKKREKQTATKDKQSNSKHASAWPEPVRAV